jgi:hypothetical protein
MSPLSLRCGVRGHVSCADHSGFTPVVDTYRLAVWSPLSFAYFSLRPAKKSRCRPAQGRRRQTTKKARKGQHRKRTTWPTPQANRPTPKTKPPQAKPPPLQLRINQIRTNNMLTINLRGRERLNPGNKRPDLTRPIEWKQHLAIGLANHPQDPKKAPIPREAGRSRDLEIALGLRGNTRNECRLAHTLKQIELRTASARGHAQIAQGLRAKPALSQIFTHRE